MAETGTDTIKDSANAAMSAIEEKTDESLNNVGIQWNDVIDSTIENLEKLQDVNTDTTDKMINQAQDYRGLIVDDVAPLVENGFNNIDGAIQDAAVSTRDLAAASRELNDALMGDNAQLVEATQQLENYRKQLDDVKNSSAVTAQQLRKAQQELDQSKAQNLNYRTILDEIASGRRDKNGNIIQVASGGKANNLGGYDMGTLVEGIAGNTWTFGD